VIDQFFQNMITGERFHGQRVPVDTQYTDKNNKPAF